MKTTTADEGYDLITVVHRMARLAKVDLESTYWSNHAGLSFSVTTRPGAQRLVQALRLPAEPQAFGDVSEPRLEWHGEFGGVELRIYAPQR